MTQSYSWENCQAASARWPQQVCVTGRCEGRPGATGQDLTRPCGGSRLAPGQLLRVFSSMKRCQRTFKMKCAKGRGGDDARRARPASAATHVPGDHQLGPASAASAHFRRRHLGSCEGQRDSGEPRARGAAGAGLGAARASQSGSGDCCHPHARGRVFACVVQTRTHTADPEQHGLTRVSSGRQWAHCALTRRAHQGWGGRVAGRHGLLAPAPLDAETQLSTW